MNNKRLNYRYKYLLIFVIIIMAVIMSGMVAMAVYSLLRSGNNEGFTWVLICYGVGAVIYVALNIFMYLTYESIIKRIYTSVNSILETFPKAERDAITDVSCGDDAVLLQKALEWFSYRQVQTDRMKFATSTTSALAAFSNEIFWEYGFLGNTMRFGDYWEKTYGDTVLNDSQSIDELLDDNAREKFKQIVTESKQSVGKTFSFSSKIKINRTKTIRVKIIGTSTLAFDEVVLFGVIRDVEQIMSVTETVNEQQRSISYILGLTADNIIYEVDRETNKLTFLNREAAQRLFGIDNLNDFEMGRRSYWELIHEDYREGFIDRFFNYDHLLMLPEQRLSYEYQVKTVNDEWIFIRHSVYVIRASEGRVRKVIGSLVNINEKKRRDLKEMYETNHDSLTGALQLTAIRSEYNNYTCRPNESKAVILFDIDSFKHLNQQYGFEVGNKILRSVVSVLWEKQIGKCYVGRVDGDKFVVLMLQVNEEKKETPEKLIEKVFDVFNDCIKIDSQTINVTLTASYAMHEENMDFDKIKNNAELALNVCKENKEICTNALLGYDANMINVEDK